MKIKRLFIPVSICGFVIPFIISDLTTLTSVGICYFWSSYIMLWNFPQVAMSINTRPLYLNDLDNSKYKDYYLRIMNLCLAILIGLFADYGIIKGILKDKTPIEISAIVGGNLSLLSAVQTEIGKYMIVICHYFKERSEKKLLENDVEVVVDNHD